MGPVAWTPELGETFDVAGARMVITELDPLRRLAWEWGDERYAFDLSPSPEGCTLRFTHVFDEQHGPAAQHAAGWETYFDRLDALLAGHPIDEIEAHVPIAELHEQYTVAFGQDPTQGRRMIATLPFRDLTLEAGPVLRLERHYRHSVARVSARDRRSGRADPLVPRRCDPRGDRVGAADTPRGDLARRHVDLPSHPGGDGVPTRLHARVRRPRPRGDDGRGLAPVLRGVDALLAGHPMDERASLDAWTDVHERYAAQWGIDPGLGRRAFAEHPLTASR